MAGYVACLQRFYLSLESQIGGCMVASWVCSVMYQFCDLDLIFRIIVSGA